MGRRSVLVVDDDPAIRESLADVLVDEGWQVAMAADGQEALDWLRANEAPGLVLLDWMMPRCDGGGFLRAVRADGRLARVPVVVLTADTRLSPPGPPVGRCLRKPVELEKLLDALEAAAGESA
jgi:CheY-like chemotaxis protein